MRRAQILAMSLLAVLVLLIGMGAGACGGGNGEETALPPGEEEEVTSPEEEEAPAEEEEELPSTPPELGEWIAQTGSSWFTFTFSVCRGATGDFGICEIVTSFPEYSLTVTASPKVPISDGQFTYDSTDYVPASMGEKHIVIQGQFDETGTHAFGTWEISSNEGTYQQSGTWEASR